MEDELKALDIFPKIPSYDFYDHIRIKNKLPVLDENFIVAVINKVITDMKYISGNIYWQVKRYNAQSLSIKFVWAPEEKIEKQISITYKFEITTTSYIMWTWT